MYVLGEVGEGILAEFGDADGCDELPPFIPAVRCCEAAMAAAEGSRVEVSAMDRPSTIDWGMWVGELDFGVPPRNSRLVENLRERMLPFPTSCGIAVAVIGDTPLSSG